MQKTYVPIEKFEEYLPFFIDAMRMAEITNISRAAAWGATIGHESAGLRLMKETKTSDPNWNWDRTRYRGRGPIQLTWKANYADFGAWCKNLGLIEDPSLFVNQPELVEQPKWGFLAASWYWLNGGARPGEINSFADVGDFWSVSRCVSGWNKPTPTGWVDREKRWHNCLAIGEALLNKESGSMSDPVWLADVLRAEGLNVIEHEGWLNRGHGDFRDVRGVMGHHTAGGGVNDWRVVQDGRPGLAGPLAQLVIEKDGSVRVIAAGVCWHAGNGAGSAWAGKFTTDANWHVIGWEAVSRGTPPWDWTGAQLESMRKVTAAILRHLGKGADWFCGHLEYNLRDGKIDPAGVDLNVFRNDVQWMIDNPPGRGPGAIELCRDHNQWLGNKLHEEAELVNPDNSGRRAHYEHGSIYWSPKTPAIPVRPEVMEFWGVLGYETSWLGYPIADLEIIPGGATQKFERGQIWRKDGDQLWFPTTGGIHDTWQTAGGPSGVLGWPQGREDMIGGKIIQQFEHGRVGWRMDMGPFVTIDRGDRDELL